MVTDGVTALAVDEVTAWLDQACELIQEAKGADGPDGGFVTDHLDAAENWLDKVRAALSPPIKAGEAVPVAFEAANAISTLERELEEARALVTEANNSLYGSQGYFYSLNGGSFDKYHLSTGIENLKAACNSRWHALTAAEAKVARMGEALKAMLQRFELYAGPNDIHAGHHDLELLKLARSALQSEKDREGGE
jgi:hypothetical protein